MKHFPKARCRPDRNSLTACRSRRSVAATTSSRCRYLPRHHGRPLCKNGKICDFFYDFWLKNRFSPLRPARGLFAVNLRPPVTSCGRAVDLRAMNRRPGPTLPFLHSAVGRGLGRFGGRLRSRNCDSRNFGFGLGRGAGLALGTPTKLQRNVARMALRLPASRPGFPGRPVL
jgi:hypothetical protein